VKQPHNLDQKHTGKPSAGNPHAGFDEAGIGNGSMVALLGHSRKETGSNRSAQPKEPRQSSTLLGDERAERPTRLRVWRGESPRAVNCLFRTASISGACGGNKA
jgi:hypothetical protein